MASGAHAQPAFGMAPAMSTRRGSDQCTRSVDSQMTSLVLPRCIAASQPLPLAMRRSVARIQYLEPSGERTMLWSRTPFSPTFDMRTGWLLFRSVQCMPSVLTDM